MEERGAVHYPRKIPENMMAKVKKSPTQKTATVTKWPREIWQLADINPAAYNPRKITQHALVGLQNSILAFGELQPIVVNRRTGNIVGGHQRFEAMRALGETEFEVVVADFDETTEKAANLSLNNQAIQGTWNDDLLDELLATLQAAPDFDTTMAQDTRLDELIAQFSTTDIELSLDIPDDRVKPGGSAVEESETVAEKPKGKHHVCPACEHEWYS